MAHRSRAAPLAGDSHSWAHSRFNLPANVADVRCRTGRLGLAGTSGGQASGAGTSKAKLMASSFSSRCSPRCSPTLAHHLAQPGLTPAPTLARAARHPCPLTAARTKVTACPLNEHQAAGGLSVSGPGVESAVRGCRESPVTDGCVGDRRSPTATGALQHAALAARSRPSLLLALRRPAGKTQ